MAPQGLTVRPAEARDLDELCAVLEQLPYDGPVPIDRAEAAAVLGQVLAMPGRTVLVADLDGRVVGTVDLIVVPNLTRGQRPYAFVESVVVAAAARRRGIGRALVDAAIEIARGAGCYKVQLLSNERRMEAHRLYESAGFTPNATGFRRYF